MNARHIVIVIAHGLVGWGLCGATMGIGIAATGLRTALIIHAVAAPIIFAAISAFYFARFAYTRPLMTATAFIAIVIFLDATVVSLVIERNFEMFKSAMGTWLPFALIFVSTYVAGLVLNPHAQSEHRR